MPQVAQCNEACICDSRIYILFISWSIKNQLMMNQNELIEKNNLYGCMFLGDLHKEKIGKKGLLLVGETKVGKSTTFNYLLGKQLRGVKKTPVKTVYECNHGVETGYEFTSVTLLPNIESNIKIDVGEGKIQQYDLIDMAGFCDANRSYVGVFIVSFMLKQVLCKLDDVKILLVIDSPSLNSNSIQGKIKPFKNFIEIIQVQALLGTGSYEQTKQVREKFISCISLVVTFADKQIDFYNYVLSDISLGITNMRQKEPYHYLIQEIIDSIRAEEGKEDEARIALFEQAKKDVVPEQSRILGTLSEPKRKWQPYNFKDPANISAPVLIHLPFKQHFQKLPAQDQKKYVQADDKKNMCIKQSFSVLKKLIQKATTQFCSQKTDYQPQFKEIQNIVNENNPYNDQSKIIEYLGTAIRIEKDQPCKVRIDLLEGLKQIDAKIAILIKCVNIENIPAKEKYQLMKKPTWEMLEVFRKVFCTTSKQESVFITFTFLIVRALRECAAVNDIDQRRGGSAVFSYADGAQDILPSKMYVIISKFISEFNVKPSQLNKFEQLVSNFVNSDDINKIDNTEIKQKIQQKRIQIQLAKGQTLNQEKNYFQSVKKYVESYKAIVEFRKCLEDSGSSISEEKLRLITAKFKYTYLKIGQGLENLQLNPMANQIYENLNAVTYSERCFKRMIEKDQNYESKYNSMCQYALCLEGYGRFEKALQVYQTIMDEFVAAEVNMKEIRHKIVDCLAKSGSPSKFQVYRQALSQYKPILEMPDIIDGIECQLEMFELVNEPQAVHKTFDQQFQHFEQQYKKKNSQAE